MKFKQFKDKGKIAAIRKSVEMNQSKSVLLGAKLKRLYEKIEPNPLQRQEIDRIRIKYAVKQRELMEEGMQAEISILEDLGNKYGYAVGTYKELEKQKVVDSKGNK